MKCALNEATECEAGCNYHDDAAYGLCEARMQLYDFPAEPTTMTAKSPRIFNVTIKVSVESDDVRDISRQIAPALALLPTALVEIKQGRRSSK